MKKKLFIISGHGGSDPGATSVINNKLYKESDLAIEFRDLLISDLIKLNISVITDSNQNALQQTLNWLKGIVYKPTDIMIDIHLNAGPSSANGTEVIIPDNASDTEKSISNDIFKVLSKYWKPRRILTESQTPRKKLGIFRPNMEQVLIELFFITNENDMNIYQNVKYSVSKEIAQILYKYINNENTSLFYIVEKGDTISSISKKLNIPIKDLILKNNISNTNIIRIGQKLIL